uniref:Uncharacterized protein n=1 Tax=Anguilla anguilla TaxID=7936 RepID=A0A0E9WI49_ANGAN
MSVLTPGRTLLTMYCCKCDLSLLFGKICFFWSPLQNRDCWYFSYVAKKSCD